MPIIPVNAQRLSLGGTESSGTSKPIINQYESDRELETEILCTIKICMLLGDTSMEYRFRIVYFNLIRTRYGP